MTAEKINEIVERRVRWLENCLDKKLHSLTVRAAFRFTIEDTIEAIRDEASDRGATALESIESIAKIVDKVLEREITPYDA